MCVGFRGAVFDGFRVPAVEIGLVLTKRHDVELSGRFGAENRNHSKRRPHGHRATHAKDLSHFLWSGRSSDVVVFGNMSQQFIAHAPAGPKHLVSLGAQPPHDLDGKLALLLGVDRRQVARASTETSRGAIAGL